MDPVDLIFKYFPDLTAEQKEDFRQLGDLYQYWNQQINVISRKDMEHFHERHVLHSLSISKIINFQSDSNILDVGSGGGFPGIPLAIMFPDVHFHLIDSTGKKVKVIHEVIEKLQLKNVTAEKIRVEQVKTRFDFIISRAVSAMPKFISWTKNNIAKRQNNDWPNGIFYLKGGNIEDEMASLKNDYEIIPIQDFFEEDFFETKKIVYVNIS